MTEDYKRRLTGLARDITRTYTDIGGINRIGETELPSLARVEGILQNLLTMAFPGYFGGRVNPRTSMETFVSSHLDEVFVDLSEVVARVLRFSRREDIPAPRLPDCPEDPDCPEIDTLAEQLTLEYLETLPELRAMLKRDVTAAYEGDPAATGPDEIILCYPGLLAVAVHRLAHPLYQLGIPFVPRIMNEWAHAQTGADIHPGARIGPDFFIDHATGVVIGETTVIGRGVKIYQGVTLGALSFRKNGDGSLKRGDKRHPTIEDEATIYANATILGGKTVIGKGAVIGGGCWVTKSVEPGGRILLRSHAD
jgi:serine O-acetyltransferase